MKMRLLLVLLGSAAAAADVGSWQIDPGASRLTFTAEQAGASFDGRFASFDADVRFDPKHLSESRASVAIDTASVDTANGERDGILTGDGWFESKQYPHAEFVADDFAATDGGFVAHGKLTIRNATVPVDFSFTVQRQGHRSVLEGNADLDRFAFKLGLGDWANTDWVGRYVHVKVVLVGVTP
jgi:polyisoprenoid-binding protein YceI